MKFKYKFYITTNNIFYLFSYSLAPGKCRVLVLEVLSKFSLYDNTDFRIDGQSKFVKIKSINKKSNDFYLPESWNIISLILF